MTKLFILILIATTFSISYVVADNVVQKTAAAATEKKDAFVKDMESEIEKISQEIEDLRAKAKDKSKDTIEKLEKRENELKAEIKKLKKSSAGAFEKVEDGVKKAWLNLKESVQAAKKEFE